MLYRLRQVYDYYSTGLGTIIPDISGKLSLVDVLYPVNSVNDCKKHLLLHAHDFEQHIVHVLNKLFDF